MNPGFVHLHVHSEYSLEDGIIPIKKLVQRCVAQGMPAIAVTDHGNLFALVKFYNAARAQGVKPIIGSELWLQGEGEAPAASLILLCRNAAGFRSLSHLLSRAYLEGLVDGKPRIRRAWLEAEDRSGLIALSAAGQGEVGQLLLRDPARARVAAERYQEWFPEAFYLEVQRNGEAEQEALNEATLALALALDLPLVATNNAHFLDRDDFPAFDARQCIAAGYTLADERRPRRFTPEHRLRSPEEMQELFADLPEACANTVQIAKSCNLTLNLGQYTLPDFPTPDGSSIEVYFRKAAEQGLEERLRALELGATESIPYRERLLREVEVILQMGFPGYFLIVADFIQWAKDHGVPVGPGRGSGAGSLVAYALRITDLDPIANALLFERFLNPERVSMPDFDIDFCMDQRDRVIQYVADKYGRERVGQIITFGTLKARAVVRDVGRVLNLPYGFVDQLAKLVPGDLGMTLAKALEESEELRRRQQEEDDVRELLDIALRLEGLPRHASTHAGGVVISPEPLADRLPLFTDGAEGSGNVTQLDKDDVEKMGLVKFDFLGLRTLTIIDIALRGINAERQAAGQAPLDIAKLPLDDPETFALLKSTETVAVFQLESAGMRDLIRRLQPDNFEDIVALVALFRPGPLQSGMVDDFIARKHGKAKVAYPHPLLEPILKDTYGVIVYQEQVMQCAQVLANYSLGGADLLRRAMGKKKPEEMAKQREIFLAGAAKNGIEVHQATAIFDLMEKFAEYGFNKSHSAAYALVSYQTAYLKTHYPQHFMAAVLTADMDHTDKVVAMISECRRMGIAILPPCVQLSDLAFRPDAAGLRYGLGAIKGLGRAAVQAIIEARARGPFRDFFDFLCRIDGQRINRRSLEALIKAGALDSFAVPRAQLLASLDSFLEAAQQQQRQAFSAQSSLFGDDSPEEWASPVLLPVPVAAGSDLNGERETLGFYLSDHPLRALRTDLRALGIEEIAQANAGQQVFLAGMVVARRSMRSKRGDRMLFLTLEDESGRMEVVVFSETWKQFRGQIRDDQPLLIVGETSEDKYAGGLRLTAQRVLELDEARELLARQIVLHVGPDVPLAVAELAALLRAHPGPTPLRIALSLADGRAVALLESTAGGVAANAVFRTALTALLDPSRQEWQYAPAGNLLSEAASSREELRRQRSA
ncbi:DNA polymerase III subunit alpha [Candidatus Igneacidithiobacillus taiwanensis]|uniref:DNA polymerase III subunit alpha n=1 Tax=Candidatus Igneacidithiobacillus taiwanensis TaxID=1945924 RepID=UPI00289644C5|nr:DNA polymerase III subunit alpha [Candidatus Igneacidithiobacillus taiwanensis]MCE5360656.1 DNA polymerase III subunit alpha [Acidithiobacillus sp.]